MDSILKPNPSIKINEKRMMEIENLSIGIFFLDLDYN